MIEHAYKLRPDDRGDLRPTLHEEMCFFCTERDPSESHPLIVLAPCVQKLSSQFIVSDNDCACG